MNDLIIMKNQQAVTSSLHVAGIFEKEHKNVLRDITNLDIDQLNFEQMFFEEKEPDVYGRPRKVIYMNRDGFTLLAMGFTGKKALQFKLNYINAFNQMEKTIKAPQQLPMTPQEKLELLLQNVGDSNKKVDQLDKRLTSIEDNAPLSPGTYSFLSRRISQRVGQVARGFGQLSPKQRGQLFRDINQGIKQISGVDPRSQLREKHYEKVMAFIQDWEPSTATKTILRQYVAEAE